MGSCTGPLQLVYLDWYICLVPLTNIKFRRVLSTMLRFRALWLVSGGTGCTSIIRLSCCGRVILFLTKAGCLIRSALLEKEDMKLAWNCRTIFRSATSI